MWAKKKATILDRYSQTAFPWGALCRLAIRHSVSHAPSPTNRASEPSQGTHDPCRRPRQQGKTCPPQERLARRCVDRIRRSPTQWSRNNLLPRDSLLMSTHIRSPSLWWLQSKCREAAGGGGAEDRHLQPRIAVLRKPRRLTSDAVAITARPGISDQ